MATVKILGHSMSRGGLIAGGVVAAGITGFIIYRKHVAAATTPAATTPYAYGYGSGYGYAGAQYAYGLGIAQYAYGSGAFAYGAFGYGAGLGSGVGVGVVQPPGGTTVVAVTNAQWAASAEAYLTQTAGYDETTVAAALGKYLTGGSLTADQAAIVQAAQAFENFPPVPGANGHPPALNMGASTGQTGTTPAGNVKVPNVEGKSANSAIATLTAAGLTHHLSMTRNPKSEYVVNSQTPGAGQSVQKGSNVDLGIAVKK